MARRYNHVLRLALWFKYAKERIDALYTPSTVCIMRLEGGQVHMNLIIRHLVALLIVGQRLTDLRSQRTDPILDELMNCTIYFPKRSSLTVV